MGSSVKKYPVSCSPQIPLCCPCGTFQLFCREWCRACYGRRCRSRARFGGLREKILARDHYPLPRLRRQ